MIVVGAGLAGLAAARALDGLDLLVLEGADRAGGRLLSEPRDDVWLNFGAHVFAGRDSATGALIDRAGVRAVQVPGRLAAVAMGDVVLTSGRVETFPLRLPLSLGERVALARAGLKLRLAVRRYAAVARPRPSEPARVRQQRMLEFMDDRSFSDFIGALPPAVAALFRATLTRSSGEPDELAAGYGVGYFHLVWSRGEGLSRTIIGGPSRLTEALAAPLAEKLVLNAKVLSVEREPGGVVVQYEHGGERRTAVARAAVVATPAHVTTAILGGVPQALTHALAEIPYGPYVVVAFLVDRPGPLPWDEIYALATPGRSFGMLFNTTNALGTGAGSPRSGSLMAYAAAGLGRDALALDDDEVRRRFLADLVGLFPEAHSVVREMVVQRWPLGLPYPRVGRSRLQAQLTQDVAPVFLAGDYLGTWYTETAAQTGADAAAAVRELLARPQ